MRNERLVRLVGPEDEPAGRHLPRPGAGNGPGPAWTRRRARTIHRTLAEVIEQDVGGVSADQVAAAGERGASREPRRQAIPRVYDLAYHFDAAGEKRKAWIYALLAAEQARRQSALEVAANNYAIAQRNAERNQQCRALPDRRRLRRGAHAPGTLRGGQPSSSTARSTWSRMPSEKPGSRLLQGEIAFKQGLMDRSIALLRKRPAPPGRTGCPRSRLGLCVWARPRDRSFSACTASCPCRLHRKPPSSQLELTVRFFNRLGSSLHLSEHAEDAVGPPVGDESCRAVAAFATSWRTVMRFMPACMSMLGWQARGARYGDRAVALAREFDDLLGHGYSCNYQGIGHYASARYEEGLAHLTEAIEAFEKAGDLWEAPSGPFPQGLLPFRPGRPRRGGRGSTLDVRLERPAGRFADALLQLPLGAGHARQHPLRGAEELLSRAGRMTSCPRSTASWPRATGTRSTAAPRRRSRPSSAPARWSGRPSA